MIIVSDTSAISYLYKIQHLHLLHSLFHTVIIPQQVAKELEYFELIEHGFKWKRKYPWIEVRLLLDNTLLNSLKERLDDGEAAAIVLSIETHADLLLIDEKMGRKIALQNGLNIIGLLGVIELAKQKKLIPAIKPLLNDLRDRVNFRISNELYERTLTLAGET